MYVLTPLARQALLSGYTVTLSPDGDSYIHKGE